MDCTAKDAEHPGRTAGVEEVPRHGADVDGRDPCADALEEAERHEVVLGLGQ